LEKQYLRPQQIIELESERTVLERQLVNPQIQDKPQVAKNLRNVNRMLAEQAPPETTPSERDALDKERRELEEQIQVGMPSSEEMRRNPPGAVGKHQAWEKRAKTAVLRWKNIMLRLNRGSQDPDIANVEKLRPRTSTLGMTGAQIEPTLRSFPSEAYKANFDQIDFQPQKGQRNISPERRAELSAAMKARHAAKKAAKQQASESHPAA